MDSKVEMIQDRKNQLQDARNEDLQAAVVEIKFLAQSWVDDFEKQVFTGKTVKELFNHQKL